MVETKHIALRADAEEIKQIELIKKYHGIKKDGPVIRFLIHQEVKKILSRNIPMGIKN